MTDSDDAVSPTDVAAHEEAHGASSSTATGSVWSSEVLVELTHRFRRSGLYSATQEAKLMGLGLDLAGIRKKAEPKATELSLFRDIRTTAEDAIDAGLPENVVWPMAEAAAEGLCMEDGDRFYVLGPLGSFKLMYERRPGIRYVEFEGVMRLCHQPKNRTKPDILPSAVRYVIDTPDRFAQAMLARLREKLELGHYDPEEDVPDSMFEAEGPALDDGLMFVLGRLSSFASNYDGEDEEYALLEAFTRKHHGLWKMMRSLDLERNKPPLSFSVCDLVAMVMEALRHADRWDLPVSRRVLGLLFKVLHLRTDVPNSVLRRLRSAAGERRGVMEVVDGILSGIRYDLREQAVAILLDATNNLRNAGRDAYDFLRGRNGRFSEHEAVRLNYMSFPETFESQPSR